MWRKFLASAISLLLLSPGWLGGSGLTLLAALVPMLWLSGQVADSKRGWWELFGWIAGICVAWNLVTIMWIGNSTPVGPIAATIASTFVTMLGFMTFHTVSRKAPKALAYTVLVSLWIALEFAYTDGDFSWPWLLLGNGLSNDIWAIQWYEYTGLFGGSLWILLSNILIYEAWQCRRRALWFMAGLSVFVPLAVSLVIYFTYEPQSQQSVKVSVLQPNVDCYDKFSGDKESQKDNLIDLISQVDGDVDFIFIPETAIPDYMWESSLERASFITQLKDTLSARLPQTMIISGANTLVAYPDGEQSVTARQNRSGSYYDVFNSAIGVTADEPTQIHHKVKLVIGVENTPTWVFEIFKFFVVDLGGVVGQIGRGEEGVLFRHNGVTTGPAICYEGLYGGFFASYVRGGAEFMGIISNDGWWGDTAGHRHLFTMSAMRAVETRRSIARSANTGISGFINSRGDILESLGWEQRGVLTRELPLSQSLTVYVKYGDYVARIAQFIALLSLLYFVAYRIKKRNYLD